MFFRIGREKALKIKGIKGFRSEYSMTLEVENPVKYNSDPFLGKMGRGYGSLPFEDNRVCP